MADLDQITKAVAKTVRDYAHYAVSTSTEPDETQRWLANPKLEEWIRETLKEQLHRRK